ncbi:hypothetical protein CY34DRAFT_145884 [Suillus luteus UH-Slu-Lm8-n1]|uniref:Uncharacterized protein n=1 Tax=Suillus luteus UH-Slu-Lm8-n1 TaxID=930992 RepID=A0A0D0AKM5_9AGAM|nr:hypothetical protein CY34DRAFT_145884 [Suillus luteus UH-Slu-Lm8-n1]
MENRDGQSQLEGHLYSSLTNLVTSSIGVDWYVSDCNNALKGRLGLQQCRKIALIAEFKPWFSFSTVTELNLPILPRQSRWDIRFLVWDNFQVGAAYEAFKLRMYSASERLNPRIELHQLFRLLHVGIGILDI